MDNLSARVEGIKDPTYHKKQNKSPIEEMNAAPAELNIGGF